MGTSKGYIAPSSPPWARAKRGITSYLTNPTDNKKKIAAEGYAKAVGTEGFSGSRAAQAFAGFASFAATSRNSSVTRALQEIGREDLLSLPPEEALNELLLDFTNGGSTIDDAIALDCISEALVVLEISSLEDLTGIDTNRLIKELVCQFAKHKFAQTFDKQIRNKFPNVEEANARIFEMQEYIYYTMESKLTAEMISEINPHNLANEPIVQATLSAGFKLLETIYGD